jgi:antitoxin MazE
MISKVQKSGNSLGINIPKIYANKAGITKGSKVSFDFKNGAIMILPYKEETLEDLLKDYNIENRHESVDWGDDLGREIIDRYDSY